MAAQEQPTRLNTVHQLTLTQIQIDATNIANSTNNRAVIRVAHRIAAYAQAVIAESNSIKCAGIVLATLKDLPAIADDDTRDAIAALTPAQIAEALTTYANAHPSEEGFQPAAKPGIYPAKDE